MPNQIVMTMQESTQSILACRWCRKAFERSIYTKRYQKFCSGTCRKEQWTFIRAQRIVMEVAQKQIAMAQRGEIDKFGLNLKPGRIEK